MINFEQWFEQQDFYPKMRYIHGDALFINENNQYRVLPVQMIYQTWQQWQTQLAVYKEDCIHNFVSSHELGSDYVLDVCTDCGHQEQRPYIEGQN